jgi:hypothetical protein
MAGSTPAASNTLQGISVGSDLDDRHGAVAIQPIDFCEHIRAFSEADTKTKLVEISLNLATMAKTNVK